MIWIMQVLIVSHSCLHISVLILAVNQGSPVLASSLLVSNSSSGLESLAIHHNSSTLLKPLGSIPLYAHNVDFNH
jgi:hypothetical protein